jgi:hypothetical protein
MDTNLKWERHWSLGTRLASEMAKRRVAEATKNEKLKMKNAKWNLAGILHF